MATRVATGTIIGGFRIESLLGEGAMGTVYHATDATGGGQVALKLLAPELARDERFRRRFLRESQLAAGLDHPHVVRTIASGEEDGLLYLAMAYVDGSDLRAVLRQEGRLEPERAVEIVAQVASALDAAHAAGLVHRDVKPGNILLAAAPDQEHAYLCDFGLARHVSSVSSLTGDRGFVGTIDYVPPEQIEGGPIDGRADVYSLGSVLFECLTGERPFERVSELSVVYAHLNEPPPRVSERRPELPAAFDGVFEIALAKSPGERYSTCGELARAARAALHGETPARRKRRSPRLLVGATAVAAAAAVAAGILFSRADSDATDVSISQTGIGGLRLGLADSAYRRAWGGGGMIVLKYPENYSKRTFDTRKTAVYFASGEPQGAIRRGTARAVEITTWNRTDRTAEGVGPCSTVDELKTAYGTRLKVQRNSVIEGNVFGYTVGKHLFFAMGPVPKPTHVISVAVHSNPVALAGFNALNDGPCV